MHYIICKTYNNQIWNILQKYFLYLCKSSLFYALVYDYCLFYFSYSNSLIEIELTDYIIINTHKIESRNKIVL